MKKTPFDNEELILCRQLKIVRLRQKFYLSLSNEPFINSFKDEIAAMNDPQSFLVFKNKFSDEEKRELEYLGAENYLIQIEQLLNVIKHLKANG